MVRLVFFTICKLSLLFNILNASSRSLLQQEPCPPNDASNCPVLEGNTCVYPTCIFTSIGWRCNQGFLNGIECEGTPGDACSAGTCLFGQCRAGINEGNLCDADGDLCTNDVCDSSNICQPGPPTICPDDGNKCTRDVCDPQDGVCKHVLIPSCSVSDSVDSSVSESSESSESSKPSESSESSGSSSQSP